MSGDDVGPRAPHPRKVAVVEAANVAGMRLDEYCRREACGFGDDVRDRMAHQVRDAAYEVIERKGATYYAVAVALVRIVESILRDQGTVLSVSNLVPGFYGIEHVYLSLPAVVGRGGVERVMHLALDKAEVDGLEESASVPHGVLTELELPE